MNEQRRVARMAVDWKVTLHLGRQVTRGQVVQFSEYGMLVTPPEVAQAGKRYELLFNVPGHRGAFRVRGFIVYSSSKGVGVRFESVPPEVTTTFRNYMASGGAPPTGSVPPGSAGPSS